MRITRTRSALIAATAAASLALSACGGGGSSDGSQEVSMTVAVTAWNSGIASIAVSQEEGYFADEGLDMNVILTDSATTQVTQIATGKAVTGAVSPEPIIIGRTGGKDIDLSYYMYYYRDNIYGLQVPESSSIQSIEDLRGKTVGAISLASASVTQAKVALKEAGVPENSVKFIAIGTGSQQATAIKNKQVDAVALLDTSFQVLDNQGIKLRALEVPGTENLSSGGLVARESDLKSDPELYAKIGRAVAKGVVFTQANPEAAIKILYKAHPESKPQGLDEAAAVASGVKVLKSRLANLGIDDSTTEYGKIDPTMLEANVDFLRKAGLIKESVPVSSFLDDSLIGDINDFDYAAVRADAMASKG